MEQRDEVQETVMMDELATDTSTISDDMSGKSSADYKVDKFKALYQCRAILSKHGTMEERRICGTQLKRMKRFGINSV